MQIGGIIAEYNPLHLGHMHHLAKAKENCDLLVIAMSGSFVQRGEPAAFDKWMRARWALLAGADLVVELPAVFALQGARGFASGGIKLMNACHCDALFFGIEQNDLDLLWAATQMISDDYENEAFRTLLKRELKSGKSYPRARHSAALALQGGQHQPASIKIPEGDVLAALTQPNFLLGAEYLRAMQAFSPHIKAHAIERVGDGHDQTPSDGQFASASAIRKMLLQEKLHCAAKNLPSFVAQDSKKYPATSLKALENMLLFVLRSQSVEQLRAVFGMQEGLENTVKSAADCSSLEDVLLRCKSKRYTLARIRRLLCATLLGLTQDLVAQANHAHPGYIRVLGFRPTARPLFRQIADHDRTRLVMRKNDFDALRGIDAQMSAFDRHAADIHALAFDDPIRRKAARDYQQKPVIL